MLALLCPGQGSQTPGMLSPWLELPGAADQLSALSDAAGLDLSAHGTVSDADTIRDTAVAQPLIVAAGLLSLQALLAALDDGADAGALAGGGRALADAVSRRVDVAAGHSVGELTAAAATGVLTPSDAAGLVAARGRAMAQASAATPTGMSAVLGGDADEVTATLGRHGLVAANVNGAGQVVAAGTLDRLQALADDPPARARVIPLQVAGAFHTEHMAPAVEAMEQAAAGTTPADPLVRLLSNADGEVVTDGADALRRLVRQVRNPVRWDLCQDTLADLGVTGLLELTPAGTLTNLARRTLRGVPAVALKTPDDLEAAAALVTEHGGQPPSPTPAPSGSDA
ncbi:ACP S-malonyltransferase [Thalassiella azotivora]